MNRLEFNERYAKSLRLIKKSNNMLYIEKIANQTKTLIDDVTKQGLLNDEDNFIYIRNLNEKIMDALGEILDKVEG